MSEELSTRLTDKRTFERKIKQGLLDEKTFEKHLKSLPDAADKAQTVESTVDGEDIDEDDGEE